MPSASPRTASNSAATSALFGSASSAAAYNSMALLPCGLNTWPASRARRASSIRSATRLSSGAGAGVTNPGCASATDDDGAAASSTGVAIVAGGSAGSSSPDINQNSEPMTATTTAAAPPMTAGFANSEPPVPPDAGALGRSSADSIGLSSFSSPLNFLLTVLMMPVMVSVNFESSPLNAVDRLWSTGDATSRSPSGGSAGASTGGAALAAGFGFLAWGAGRDSGFGLADGFGAGLADGFGAGLTAGLAVGDGAPLALNAESGASR